MTEKYNLRGLFLEFYGIFNVWVAKARKGTFTEGTGLPSPPTSTNSGW